jgi:hypothetical protein
MAFLQEYSNPEHFVLLNGDCSIEDTTEDFFKNYFAPVLNGNYN